MDGLGTLGLDVPQDIDLSSDEENPYAMFAMGLEFADDNDEEDDVMMMMGQEEEGAGYDSDELDEIDALYGYDDRGYNLNNQPTLAGSNNELPEQFRF